jgi:hypothetical protein
VTDEKAINDVHAEIVTTLPPIVGLLNGAMVLRDVSVRNMEFDQVTDVIASFTILTSTSSCFYLRSTA